MPDRNGTENFHSEETREIMGAMPSWIVRWGITLLCVILTGIVIGCYFIKYPETVKGTVVITTVNPPADLTARYDGLIQNIYVNNGDPVKKGALIAIISNPADYNSVLAVESNLQNATGKPCMDFVSEPWIETEYSLGDLQTYYSEFRKQCLDYKHYLKIDVIKQKKTLLSEQINKNRTYYNQSKKQLSLLQEELELDIRNYRRDSTLFDKKLISAVDFDNSYKNTLQKKSSIESFKGSMINTELSIIQNEQQIIELTTQFNNETASYERQISQSRQNLLSQIEQWKQQYIIEAPVDGTVTLTNYWSGNQKVNIGDRIASIVPEGKMRVVGRMNILSSGLGKVKEGMTVNVKLYSYPHMEFGMLKGTVKSVSTVPEKGQGYIAEIVFPENLITTYNKELQLIQQMDGDGEIITEDLRLIHRFVQPIRSVFQR